MTPRFVALFGAAVVVTVTAAQEQPRFRAGANIVRVESRQSFTRALLGDRPLVSRRGPSTGLHYQRTTDSEFRRTERLRVAIPRLVPRGTVTARLLGPDEKPLAVVITLGEQVEPEFGDMIVADVTLAPLAQAEYELEVSLEKEGQKETTTYRFAIVP